MGVVAGGETISTHVVRDLRNELEVASSEETRFLGKIPGDEYNKVFEILLHQILEELKQLNVKSAPPPEVPPMKTHDWETPYLENTRTLMGTVAGLLATVALTGGINPPASLLYKLGLKLTFHYYSLWTLSFPSWPYWY